MDKTKLLKALNPVLALSFLAQVCTIAMLVFHIETVYSKLFFKIHKTNGILILALIFAHILLNFGWIKSVYFKR